jgi:hypothetical protein
MAFSKEGRITSLGYWLIEGFTPLHHGVLGEASLRRGHLNRPETEWGKIFPTGHH